MTLERPDLLALLVLVPALVALAWRTRQRRVQGARLVLVTALRALVLGALVLALARPWLEDAAPSAPAGRTRVYVVDVSSSVDPGAALDAVERDLARGAPPRVGVVAVAGAAAWARAVSDAPLERAALEAALARADVGPRDASRFARGLRLARAGVVAGGRDEVVLATDGRETDAPGEAALEAARLAASGVAVRALPVGREGLDARAVALVAPAPVVHEGAGVALTARVAGPARDEAGRAREVEVRLERDGSGEARPDWTRRLRLGPEEVALTFADRAERPGVQRYRLSVRVPGDVEARNDVATLALEVRGGPRVLVVAEGEASAGVVPAALRAAGFEVEQVAPDRAPDEARDLERFDAVALVDVPVRAADGLVLPAPAQRALREYARAGGGVLVLGGERSFGPGGYLDSPLEELLPVRSEPPALAEVPDVALVLLVDRSGSMGRGPKLEMAKVAAREAAAFLGARDLLGVVGFRADAEWWVEPTQGAAEAIVREVLGAQAAGGGTDLLPALALAADAMARSTARVKHVVVLSDGITPRAVEVLAAVEALRAAGVTTSTVAVGGDADQDLLRRVAEAGGGRFHGAIDLSTVPRIVTEEALEASRRSAVTEPFRPRVVRAARALRGVDLDRAPPLVGLLPTEARPGAEVLLLGPEDRPLLAAWDVGAGRCAAWTSDAGARWAREWVGWDGFTRLLGQLARAVARPAERLELGAPIVTWIDGDRLVVEAGGAGDEDALVLEPLGPGSPVTVPLDRVASDRRRGAAPLPDGSVYRARLRGRAGVAPGARVLAVGPLAEVAAGLGPDPAALEAIAAAGRPSGPAAPRPGRRSLVPPLLVAACALLLAEVVVRRTA